MKFILSGNRAQGRLSNTPATVADAPLIHTSRSNHVALNLFRKEMLFTARLVRSDQPTPRLGGDLP